MKRVMLILTLGMLIALVAWPASAEDHAYIGLKKCGMCHKKDTAGAQLAKWQESAHAQAFANLSSEAGLAKAKELGVADPATDAACLKCHSTGHGAAAELTVKLVMENGVTCEACHGAGGDYFKKATMTGIRDGSVDGAPLGYVKPTAETCQVCHPADNPGHKGEFDFDEMVKTIAHPVPAAE